MIYKLHITNSAIRDLTAAADYIEFCLLNPKAADELLNEAERIIPSLAEFPRRYAICDDPVLREWEIRFATVKNYLAFYTVSEKNKTVYVIRFLYEKRDWSSILRGGFTLD